MQTKMQKAKKLSPSLREKRHYLAVMDGDEKLIESVILSYIGAWGWAKAGVQIKEEGKINDRHYSILSVITKWQEQVKAALALSKCKVIGISGTIRKLKQKWLI
jgi:RNase P/RNase MRP subunit POP5